VTNQLLFRDFPSKPHREESKPPSILPPVLLEIMENPSPSIFRSGIFSIQITSLPAHGNGYADPNFLIPPTIEAVTVDGGVVSGKSICIDLHRSARDHRQDRRAAP
jgi:hypothetical protein